MIKTPINSDVTTSVTATLTASPIENDSATGGSQASKVAGEPESFATDSWSTIKSAVHNGNTSSYHVGDTKTVTINNKDYTVRIANKSTNENCSDSSYSETACGFVIEFVDIITEMQMRDIYTNIGGYPATLVHDYLNNTLYGQLPEDLQDSIKPTRVISGYGDNESDSSNFTTTDNLYLLSAIEVYGTDLGGNNLYDTAAETTHQLEYYSNNGVTYSSGDWTVTNSDIVIKLYNSSNFDWWLRQADSCSNNAFFVVTSVGWCGGSGAANPYGLAPAFRIG